MFLSHGYLLSCHGMKWQIFLLENLEIQSKLKSNKFNTYYVDKYES